MRWLKVTFGAEDWTKPSYDLWIYSRVPRTGLPRRRRYTIAGHLDSLDVKHVKWQPKLRRLPPKMIQPSHTPLEFHYVLVELSLAIRRILIVNHLDVDVVTCPGFTLRNPSARACPRRPAPQSIRAEIRGFLCPSLARIYVSRLLCHDEGFRTRYAPARLASSSCDISSRRMVHSRSFVY